MRYFRPHLRKLRLTEQQWRVMRLLNESGPIDAGRLAADAVLLPQSLSRIVRDLARRRFIERRTLRDDRRRAEVSITAAGIAALGRGAHDSTLAYEAIAKRFGARELDSLLALLDRLERTLTAGTADRRA
jgi:homoprotocatechuate degradation regulator HpaR